MADTLDAVSNVDAEQACLGILLDPQARNDYWREKAAEVRHNVNAEDFFRESHQAIFRAICEVTDESGDEADYWAIARKLPTELREYACSLIQVMPSCAHAGWYAATVREAAIRRRSLQALGDAAALLYDQQEPVQGSLMEVHRLLDEATVGIKRDAGLFDLVDLSGEVDDLYEHGSARGVGTGWPEIDEFYTVSPGQWTLVTGIPSHGKSAFVDALLVNLAKRNDWTFAVCSPENQPLARHVAKLARLYQGKPFDRAMYEERMNRDELVAAKAWLHDHFTFVLPHENERSVKGVLACMEAAVQRRPLNGIAIDPWNELDHSRPSGQTETEFISESLTRIRQFARRHQLHVWLVAHPAKLERPRDGGSYPVPRPYDVSGSAHWFNKADNCLTVYRDDEDRWVEVHVQKVRFDANGKRGVVRMTYSKGTGQFAALRAAI